MKSIKSMASGLYLVCAIFGLTTGAANAGTIIGGSSLLSAGDVTQLETWLGEGPLALTNVFTKGATGTNATDWHNAVDNIGRTFSIMRITALDPSTGQRIAQTLGGYNPQSWNSDNSYNVTPLDDDRTAFIFNLTTGIIQRQCLTTDPLTCGIDGSDGGMYQTYNGANMGPTFGGGHDLTVSGALDSGYSYNWSYGASGHPTGWGGENGLDPDPNEYVWEEVTALETFTLAADDSTRVPEPSTIAILALGLAGLGFARRRRALSER